MLIDTLGDRISPSGALAVRREGLARWITTLKSFPILPQWLPAPPVTSPAWPAPRWRRAAGSAWRSAGADALGDVPRSRGGGHAVAERRAVPGRRTGGP